MCSMDWSEITDSINQSQNSDLLFSMMWPFHLKSRPRRHSCHTWKCRFSAGWISYSFSTFTLSNYFCRPGHVSIARKVLSVSSPIKYFKIKVSDILGGGSALYVLIFGTFPYFYKHQNRTPSCFALVYFLLITAPPYPVRIKHLFSLKTDLKAQFAYH